MWITQKVLVITPLKSFIQDQILKVSFMKLSGCDLGEEINNLADVASGKYSTVYATVEVAMNKKFHKIFEEPL